MPRQISNRIAKAFLGLHKYKQKNSLVVANNETAIMYLHGSAVASLLDNGTVIATVAGFNTPVTRDRVNTLLFVMGSPYRFNRKAGQLYYAGVPIDNFEYVVLRTIDEHGVATFHDYNYTHTMNQLMFEPRRVPWAERSFHGS